MGKGSVSYPSMQDSVLHWHIASYFGIQWNRSSREQSRLESSSFAVHPSQERHETRMPRMQERIQRPLIRSGRGWSVLNRGQLAAGWSDKE